MVAFTFDTGALIALERGRQRMVAVFKTARIDRIPVIVPGVCIAEWWRGRTDIREKILAAVVVQHTDDALVKVAGEALAKLPKATCIDTMAMAVAARYGGAIFTSDIGDLLRLQTAFPSVRVLGV
jgi:predicted nucleic acid-binding protein